MNMAYLTQRQEKKLLKHIEKWGIPFSRSKITWVAQKEVAQGLEKLQQEVI
jgi:hypothetical protein